MFTLQILHASDLEGGVEALEDAANFATIWSTLEAEAEAEGLAVVEISSGDNWIPGPFLTVGADVDLQPAYRAAYQAIFDEPGLTNIRASAGRIDITVLNALGIDSATFGNHEFDLGSDVVELIIEEDVRGANLSDIRWLGAQFPYLSANLDFSADPFLGNLFTDDILLSTEFTLTPDEALAGLNPFKIAQATLVEEQGELIGIIGATTQELDALSSPTGTVSTAGEVDDMALLAQVIQPVIDAVRAGADGVLGTADDVNKIILASHLQDLNNEIELAGLLNGVDIIIGGGSNTRLADENDPLLDGDVSEGDYPLVETGADGNTTLIVNTDGNYTYVGALRVTFDDAGNIDLASLDNTINGAFKTDEAGVLAVTGAATLDEAIAGSEAGTIIADLTDAAAAIITALDGDVFGQTDVFLEGRREAVRTEETNLGNLSADANIFATRAIDPTVTVSIKNGGGIRAQIGELEPATGELLPTIANPLAGKEAGDISQLDIENALRFNNQLSLISVTAEGLKVLLEHAVSQVAPGATPGGFAQVGGVAFSYDPDGTAQVLTGGVVSTPGNRVQSITLLDDDGNPVRNVVVDGEIVEGAPQEIRVVTLSFLADGGDSYPFASVGFNRVDTGIGEQTALADFLAEEFNTAEGDAAFAEADTTAARDTRIQNLNERSDTVDAPIRTGELEITRVVQFDSGAGEGGSEVVSFDNGVLATTDGAQDRISLIDAENGTLIRAIDLTGIEGYDTVTSVAIRDGVVAAAIRTLPVDTTLFGVTTQTSQPGIIALFDATTGALISTIEVGNLPDQVVFSADGNTLVVAGEGEFNDDSDNDDNSAGTISIIDVTDASAPTVEILDFTQFDGLEDLARAAGIRIAPGVDFSLDVEPEYISISPDGTQAFVSLQEANAIAILDLVERTIIDVIPVGVVDHSVAGNEIDVNDRDGGIFIETHADLVGLRMPDTIASVEIEGETFILSANEGDGRGDATDGFDEARVGDILDGEVEGVSFDASVNTTGLERLIVSTIDGDTDGDGDIDVIHAFGSRSFTIYQTDGTVVFDSGSQFERIVAELNPTGFNSDDGPGGAENRSDNRGPEPEALEVGVINGQTYAFIGLERDSGIMIYNITTPAEAFFVDYIPGFGGGDISPEVIEFISAEDSATGNAQIAVAYEISGTTSVFDIALPEVTIAGGAEDDDLVGNLLDNTLLGGAGDDTLDGAAGDDLINGGGGDNVLIGGSGDDTINGANGNDDVFGGDDNDTIATLGGNDTVDAGAGDDTVDAGNGANRVLGGLGNDIITTGNGADSVVGGDGGDTITTGGGIDQVQGGAGNDAIFTLGGADSIDGGTGDDNIDAGVGNDTVLGGVGNDTISGSVGNDSLNGGDGIDDINGGAGNDSLVGGIGNDLLVGAAGDDVIDGGVGNDFLSGGAGGDRFVFLAGFGSDRLVDFEAELDVLDFSGHAAISVFDDLNLVTRGDDLLVLDGEGGRLLLRGVAIGDLSEDNFVF